MNKNNKLTIVTCLVGLSLLSTACSDTSNSDNNSNANKVSQEEYDKLQEELKASEEAKSKLLRDKAKASAENSVKELEDNSNNTNLSEEELRELEEFERISGIEDESIPEGGGEIYNKEQVKAIVKRYEEFYYEAEQLVKNNCSFQDTETFTAKMGQFDNTWRDKVYDKSLLVDLNASGFQLNNTLQYFVAGEDMELVQFLLDEAHTTIQSMYQVIDDNFK